MSKLLHEGTHLLFSVDLSMKLGLNQAIVLQQLHYWLGKSEHKKEGYVWIYNTYEDWQKQFPFTSVRTIRSILKELEEQEIIVTGNYNKFNMDRTKWYRINYKHDIFACGKKGQSMWQNSPLPDVEKSAAAIPIDYQEITTINKNNIKEKKKEHKKENDLAAFQQFWELYPKKVDKKKAEKSFLTCLKQYPSDTIINGTLGYVQHIKKMRTERQYIKHPSTFLNNHSFLNEYEGENNSEVSQRRYADEYNLPF